MPSKKAQKNIYIAILVVIIIAACAFGTYKAIQPFVTGSIGTGPIVELYDRINFCGNKQTFTAEGDYAITTDIRPSSIRVAPGYVIWAYVTTNYTGEYDVLQGEIADLSQQSSGQTLYTGNVAGTPMNNMIKSIKVLKIDRSIASSSLTPVTCPYVQKTYTPILRNQIQTSQGSSQYVPYNFNFNGPVVYTLSLDIYIDALQPNWRNILHFGNGDGDRTPGLWTYPWSSYLHFRQRSIYDWNDGCDVPAPGMKRWFNYTAVVNSNSIIIYIDYVEAGRRVGPTFSWGVQSGKQFNIGLNVWLYKTPGVYIRNLYFIPEAMNINDVRYYLSNDQ